MHCIDRFITDCGYDDVIDIKSYFIDFIILNYFTFKFYYLIFSGTKIISTATKENNHLGKHFAFKNIIPSALHSYLIDF